LGLSVLRWGHGCPLSSAFLPIHTCVPGSAESACSILLRRG
jgi:hypothetical protein